ncbi:substrate-binding domain-containing protein [Pyxidicoccus xibeiensis]|uniref:substrate-binding domain-containing protein n=1 Tax=Pyxidicoccus xibeiensis TaxID=2906759 RepID=UPI0020A82E02|nr:substrate-binding domain-containing protein [Pyxidicoccus xibeiensis]MCP3136156.1 substrate-binding domain-containing protein [Pyxidicoccus xibeiensis]
MKMMKMVMSAAVVAVSVVGCGGQSSGVEAPLAPSTSSAELTNGNWLFGSDTLKGAMISAGISSASGLIIQGKGSGVGEGCMRTGATYKDAAGNTVTACAGRQQTIAPMSRDLKSPCQAGESSNIVALDAVSAFVSASNGVTNITTANLTKVFFSNTGACISDWSALGRATGGAIVKYRRDDVSGTTDTFKTLLGGTTFCSDVVVVSDNDTAKGCTGLSATDCIEKLTANNNNAIGYSGDSAKTPAGTTPANLALSVDGIAPTAANVRKLVSGASGVYPLSRFIFVNENINFAKDTKEQKLYDWMYNNKQSFENILVGQGFISCSTNGPLECGGDLNDGRGAGACYQAF